MATLSYKIHFKHLTHCSCPSAKLPIRLSPGRKLRGRAGANPTRKGRHLTCRTTAPRKGGLHPPPPTREQLTVLESLGVRTGRGGWCWWCCWQLVGRSPGMLSKA